MRRVGVTRVERLDPPPARLELVADRAVDLALAAGLGQCERWLAVVAAQGVDQLLGALPAQRDDLAILLPAVVGERAVELARELLVV